MVTIRKMLTTVEKLEYMLDDARAVLNKASAEVLRLEKEIKRAKRREAKNNSNLLSFPDGTRITDEVV